MDADDLEMVGFVNEDGTTALSFLGIGLVDYFVAQSSNVALLAALRKDVALRPIDVVGVTINVGFDDSLDISLYPDLVFEAFNRLFQLQ